jgi:hypothetical protein
MTSGSRRQTAAGDSDVEEEKGAISDAFKRAAVKWGIGRYLYDMPTPWVPCEVGRNGKWKKWKADPWTCVRMPSAAPQARLEAPKAVQANAPARPVQEALPGRFQPLYDQLEAAITDAETMADLGETMKDRSADIDTLPEDMKAALRRTYSFKAQALRTFGEAA